MRGAVYGFLLTLVVVAGITGAALSLGAEGVPSDRGARLVPSCGVFLACTLLSLAAAQAYDRGHRLLPTFAILLIVSSGALGVAGLWWLETDASFWRWTGTLVTAAFLLIVACGAVVVRAPRHDAWIAGAVVFLATVTGGVVVVGIWWGDGVHQALLPAYILMACAAAALSIRARWARVSHAVPSDVCPTCGQARAHPPADGS